MIKLEKTPEPAVLQANSAAWTQAIIDRVSSGEKPTKAEKSRYRHADIKVSLINETYGKCAYCESKLLHITYGDVEHIHPKSKAVTNLFSWQNLTLACDRCNTNKDDEENVVDPYVDEPSELFEFPGALVIPHAASERAVLTERLLKLNRPELLERRAAKIRYLHDQLIVLSNAKDERLRQVLRKDLLNNETSPDQEFAATARQFIDLMLPKVIEPEPAS